VFSERRHIGYVLAALGSAGLIVSLWQPWYTFRIPGLAIARAVQFAQSLGALGPLVRQGAELARHLGPIHVTAWQLFTTGPAVLLVAGVVAGGLSLMASTERASNVSRIVVVAALIGVAVPLFRILNPPGSGGVLHPAWGIWLALISALVVLTGGLVAGSDERDRQPIALPLRPLGGEPQAWSTTRTVPPPTDAGA
jgi:hypothetical protein